jgi:1-phosphofructokinase family hexose kinase
MIYTVTLNPALDKEYTVPTLVFDDVMRMDKMRIDYGGKGFNVARMLKSLRKENIALGLVGGHTGNIISQGLEALGIITDLTIIAEETRTNTSIVDAPKNHYIKINEKGPVVSNQEVEMLLEKIKQLADEGDYWVLAGSLPTNVPSNIYAKITRIVNEVGGYVILDTSGDPLKIGIQAAPYLAKPNQHEINQIFDTNASETEEILELVDKLHAQGIKNVLVSLGKDGALLSTPEGHWNALPPRIKAQNPIGAGDAMVAGLVWRLDEGDSASEALPWAIACGTAAANEPGTGMPSLSVVKDFKQKVIIKEI